MGFNFNIIKKSGILCNPVGQILSEGEKQMFPKYLFGYVETPSVSKINLHGHHKEAKTLSELHKDEPT